MKKYKILNTIGEAFADEGKKILESFAEVDYKIPDQKELDDTIHNYDACVVGLGVTFHEDTLKKAKNLKAIATATTGLDHIDVSWAEKNNINVVSLRGEREFLDTLTATSELAWGLLIGLMRRIPWAFARVLEHEWNREDFRVPSRLYGKTLGIVGMGRLGTHMARYARAFGMNVVFYDPHVEAPVVDECKKVSLEALARESDVISINVHLTDETEGLIDKRLFGMMKPNIVIINTSRGRVVDEKELLRAIKDKRIAGYATDVLGGELNFKEKAEHALISYAKENDNILIVPHIGGLTNDSRKETDIFIARKLKKYLEE
ncbi:hydroxyacid dehydrogenase [bacterium]|nr:hydroxyacid dehydrogenase [bacterium]|tara:strand:- start:8629 stop:9585 length:957 start_codon:yes stop_codon:yes gene_type:complete